MHVQVIRKFPGSDDVGAIMDASDWPVNRAHQLIKRRFLQPVFGTPQPQVVAEVKRGPGRPPKVRTEE